MYLLALRKFMAKKVIKDEEDEEVEETKVEVTEVEETFDPGWPPPAPTE